jgi:DNA uptake protein ComE-like DNA-binding protein
MGRKKKRAAGGGHGLVDVAAVGLGLASLAASALERRQQRAVAERAAAGERASGAPARDDARAAAGHHAAPGGHGAERPGEARLGPAMGVAQVAVDTARAVLDLNAASPDALRSLPRIGRKRARKILAHRPFGRVKDLKKVLPKRVYKVVKHQLTV